MLTRRYRCVSSIGVLSTLLVLCVGPLCTAVLVTYPDHVGPFVDSIVFKVIEGDDQQVLALLEDEVDLIGDVLDLSDFQTLGAAEDINVAQVLRNGYGYFTIKTDKYPFNITDFRRAFAFALDKDAISQYVWDGLSVPLDSCVPLTSPWSIEGQLPYSYYEADVDMGNHLLDRAGFYDHDSDGFREAPDGSEFDVLVATTYYSDMGAGVAELAVNALQSLHIDATWSYDEWYDLPNCLYFHTDYDIAFVGRSFQELDVDWLAYEYWSAYADEPYFNYPCWQNGTYDSWRNQLLRSTDYDEVYEAAIEMQKVLVYECPIVVCYENFLITAYRTDRFEGFVNSAFSGVPCWWTNYRAHLKSGVFGGMLRWSNGIDLESFNHLASSSDYTRRVLVNLYDSLIRQGPDGNDLPWLAENYTTELDEDNPSIPDGHTRFTFNLVHNATWTDGRPMTGEDVAYTLNFYREAVGCRYHFQLANMTAAYSPTNQVAVVEFSCESYWQLHDVGYLPIMPRHVLETIGPENWNTWNPNPPAEEMVTSGPFNISEYVPGEYCNLAYNPIYFHGIEHVVPTETSDTNTTGPGDQTVLMSTLGIVVTAGSSVVILIVCADTVKRRGAGE